MIDLIAHTQSRTVKPSGEEELVTIGVSLPTQQPTGEFGCGVVLPDSPEPRIIYGADSLQALSLALRFIAERIDDMISKGWKFHYGDSSDRFPFEAYFMTAAWTQELESIAKKYRRRTEDEDSH